MKKFLLLFAIVVLFSMASCTDATMSKISGLGDSFKVQLVNCDGTITHTWISTGKVQSEEHSDGYFFREKGTGKLIEVTGTLIITNQ